MKKFAVFSGFLGSGKTTTMMALSKYFSANHAKAAMISNDLGSQSLADNKLAALELCNASELTGECICYQTENLVNRLNELFESGCELVISDIPGFGVGALEHVYHTLTEDYPGMFELAPFTVLVEPRTVDILRRGTGADMEYILNTQLREADLIVLNKCDILDNAAKEVAAAYLTEHYPQASLVCVSALNGEGLEELSQALKWGCASMQRPDIGYGGANFSKAMGRISEYYIQCYASVCCNDFDGNACLLELAEAIRRAVSDIGADLPHMKLLAWQSEGEYGKVDIISINRNIEVNHRFSSPCTEVALMLNGSAICPAKELDELVSEALERISEKFQLELVILKKECFGMLS